MNLSLSVKNFFKCLILIKSFQIFLHGCCKYFSFSLFFYLFFIFIFCWNIIALWCCVSFYCTTSWISYINVLLTHTLRRKWQPTPVFVRKIPWIEEPGRLPSMGSQRVGHDWACTRAHTLLKSHQIYTKFLFLIKERASIIQQVFYECLLFTQCWHLTAFSISFCLFSFKRWPNGH